MDSTNVLEGQIQKLEEKARGASLPSDLLAKIEEELAFLRSNLKASVAAGGSFANFESVASYINWVTSLPFNKETQDILNLVSAKQILDKNHYGLEDCLLYTSPSPRD